MRALQSAKVRYRAALSTLEAISEEVHLKRRMAAMLPPRTPGVGAENLSDVGSDLPSINLGRPEGLSDFFFFFFFFFFFLIFFRAFRIIIDY